MEKVSVHIFACPNADYFHGQGPNDYFYDYLMIHGARLWAVKTYRNLKDGTEEVDYTWRLEKRENEFVLVDDPSDSLIQGILQYDNFNPIYHVRICRKCHQRGIRGWEDTPV